MTNIIARIVPALLATACAAHAQMPVMGDYRARLAAAGASGQQIEASSSPLRLPGVHEVNCISHRLLRAAATALRRAATSPEGGEFRAHCRPRGDREPGAAALAGIRQPSLRRQAPAPEARLLRLRGNGVDTGVSEVRSRRGHGRVRGGQDLRRYNVRGVPAFAVDADDPARMAGGGGR
jgi:hypothetical protein